MLHHVTMRCLKTSMIHGYILQFSQSYSLKKKKNQVPFKKFISFHADDKNTNLWYREEIDMSFQVRQLNQK